MSEPKEATQSQILGVVQRLDKSVQRLDSGQKKLRQEMQQGFKRITKHFDVKLDKESRHLEHVINAKIDKAATITKAGFDDMSERFNQHDARFDQHDAKFSIIHHNIGEVRQDIIAHSGEISEVHSKAETSAPAGPYYALADRVRVLEEKQGIKPRPMDNTGSNAPKGRK